MPGSRWRSQQLWEPLTEYESAEHIAGLSASGLSLTAYAKQRGISRNALAQAVKRDAPELYAKLVADNPAEGKPRSGAKFETSVKGLLVRRGYLVVKQYASKSAFDMVAFGRDRPVLLVQAKRDGKLPFSEWNALWDLAVEFGAWPVMASKAEPQGAHFYRLTERKEKKGQRQDQFLAEFDPREPLQDSLLVPALAASA